MSNHSQSEDSGSVYKSPQTYSQYQSQSSAHDTSDSAQPQRYSPPQTPSQPSRPYLNTTYPPQYSNQAPPQYSNQYPQQYQGNYQQQYQGGYPAQSSGQYPPQYSQQYPPQYPQQPGAYPGQYQGQYPGRFPQGQYYQQPENMAFGQPPRERGVFSNFFDGAFSAMLGTLIISPFIKARKMLSIKPETHPGEKLQRYMYGLPQLLRQQGIATLWKDMGSSIAKIPAQTLDLSFFFALKKVVHPSSRVMPWDVSWVSNILVAGSAAGLRYLTYQPIMDAYGRISAYQSNVKGYVNELKNNLQNRYKNRGFKGLYSNVAINIPTLMLYRGLQLGTIEPHCKK